MLKLPWNHRIHIFESSKLKFGTKAVVQSPGVLKPPLNHKIHVWYLVCKRLKCSSVACWIHTCLRGDESTSIEQYAWMLTPSKSEKSYLAGWWNHIHEKLWNFSTYRLAVLTITLSALWLWCWKYKTTILLGWILFTIFFIIWDTWNTCLLTCQTFTITTSQSTFKSIFPAATS